MAFFLEASFQKKIEKIENNKKIEAKTAGITSCPKGNKGQGVDSLMRNASHCSLLLLSKREGFSSSSSS